MLVPLSWLKDFVTIDRPVGEVDRILTNAGLEVKTIEYIGIPGADLVWDRDLIVLGHILKVEQHLNADKLVLATVEYGADTPEVVVTGAPNLFHLRGQGPLPTPIKAAYAREGSTLYDGHEPGRELMTLKRAKIRGVDSYSMVCSEKELGISDEHEGIILLDDDAPVGTPLADYMGDVVLTVKINPNMARNAMLSAIT